MVNSWLPEPSGVGQQLGKEPSQSRAHQDRQHDVVVLSELQ
jgi:hypothetical protein